jgi:hypothetical protein
MATLIDHMMIDSPAHIGIGIILILLIVYSSVIPIEYKKFADSTLGRIIGIGLILAAIHTMGWIYGLLTAMAFLMILHGGILVRGEGFDGGGTVSEKQSQGNRWWVERILGETPTSIATDRVTTNAPG